MAKQKQGDYKRKQWDKKGERIGFSSTAGEITAPVRKGRGWGKRGTGQKRGVPNA